MSLRLPSFNRLLLTHQIFYPFPGVGFVDNMTIHRVLIVTEFLELFQCHRILHVAHCLNLFSCNGVPISALLMAVFKY